MARTTIRCALILALGVLAEPALASSEEQREVYVIADFTQPGVFDGWHIQDDVVMGGRSKGAFSVSEDGYAVFSGDVSLENNGGFSSAQFFFGPIDASAYRKAVLRVQGDGKRYQFRVESDHSDRHAYIYPFETTGEWQTIEVPFSEMYPSWRGNRLDLPNYPGKTMGQARFLIANGLAESFELKVKSISLK